MMWKHRKWNLTIHRAFGSGVILNLHIYFLFIFDIRLDCWTILILFLKNSYHVDVWGLNQFLSIHNIPNDLNIKVA